MIGEEVLIDESGMIYVKKKGILKKSVWVCVRKEERN